MPDFNSNRAIGIKSNTNRALSISQSVGSHLGNILKVINCNGVANLIDGSPESFQQKQQFMQELDQNQIISQPTPSKAPNNNQI